MNCFEHFVLGSMCIINSFPAAHICKHAIYKRLRAILQESEEKLEMKILTPLQFLCVGRLPWGIYKNNDILIGRCIVAMVTALYDVGLGTMF